MSRRKRKSGEDEEEEIRLSEVLFQNFSDEANGSRTREIRTEKREGAAIF